MGWRVHISSCKLWCILLELVEVDSRETIAIFLKQQLLFVFKLSFQFSFQIFSFKLSFVNKLYMFSS